MLKVEKILKPATYCRYKKIRGNLDFHFQGDFVVVLPVTPSDFATHLHLGPGFLRAKLLLLPWFKNRENFYHYDAYGYHLSDKTLQRSEPFGTCFQRRHCSRCTFVDGKIPKGFRITFEN
jgi:hypothetical protein